MMTGIIQNARLISTVVRVAYGGGSTGVRLTYYAARVRRRVRPRPENAWQLLLVYLNLSLYCTGGSIGSLSRSIAFEVFASVG
jgi:hypothetical protein